MRLPPPRAVEADAVFAPDREGYAASQAQLLDALLRGGDYPAGFATAQARAAGHSLRRKRAHVVSGMWPALAHELGEEFAPLFDSFARTSDRPASGDPLADGLAFACSLSQRGRPLGDAARTELLLARAALRRRGLFVRVAWLRRPHPRVLVVARVPWLGPWHRSFASPSRES